MLKKLATLAGAVGARGSGPWAVIRGRPLDPGWPGCWATASRLNRKGARLKATVVMRPGGYGEHNQWADGSRPGKARSWAVRPSVASVRWVAADRAAPPAGGAYC